MSFPPSSEGRVHCKVTESFVVVIAIGLPGKLGVVKAFFVVTIGDSRASEIPYSLTAKTLAIYSEPLISFLMVQVVNSTLSSTVTQESREVSQRSTM